MDRLPPTTALQHYLYQQIPLSQAMAVQVEEITPDALRLAASLAPNINHQHTLFGGSGVTLCILACWSLLHCRLQAAGLAGDVVIQRQQMHYLRPATADVWAEAQFINETDWPRFVHQLERKGRARLALQAVMVCGDERVGEFTGEFVVLRG